MRAGLIEHARAHFRLARREADGRSFGQHLQAAAAQGADISEHLPPPLPPEVAHVWAWFRDLDDGRGGSGFGPNPIGWSELADWARLRSVRPTAFEIECLRALDREFMTARSASSADANPT